MATSISKWLGCTLVALTLAGPAFAGPPQVGAAPSPTSAETANARPAPAAADDRARYSLRESNAPGLEKYRGGDGGTEVYIGVGSGAVVILLLVIILLIVL